MNANIWFYLASIRGFDSTTLLPLEELAEKTGDYDVAAEMHEKANTNPSIVQSQESIAGSLCLRERKDDRTN